MSDTRETLEGPLKIWCYGGEASYVIGEGEFDASVNDLLDKYEGRRIRVTVEPLDADA